MIVPSLISGIIIFDAYAKLLILILIAVSFADSSAYFFGKRYGNKILLKNTSPGKTLEGLIGAGISTPIFLGLLSGLLDIKLGWQLLTSEALVRRGLARLSSAEG